MNIPYRDRKLPEDSEWTLLEDIVNQKTKVLVRCKCGNEKRVSPQILFNGVSNRCSDCGNKKKFKSFRNIGGLRSHPAYGILDGIKQRCNNPKSQSYEYYGGIGITVCDLWNNSYVEFCKWADENGYKKGLSIDRIDPNKGYSPDNCRFVPIKDQRENKHKQKNNTSGFSGVSFAKNVGKWHSYYWVDGERITVGYFSTAKEASIAREKELEVKNINYIRIEYADNI